MPFGTQTDVAKVARNLVVAWDSGDRRRLEAAVRQAALELGAAPRGSALRSELRDLVLGVVQGLDSLLSASHTAIPQRNSQWEVCYDLLRHAHGTAEAESSLGGQA
jgi:hypothetical protein